MNLRNVKQGDGEGRLANLHELADQDLFLQDNVGEGFGGYVDFDLNCGEYLTINHVRLAVFRRAGETQIMVGYLEMIDCETIDAANLRLVLTEAHDAGS